MDEEVRYYIEKLKRLLDIAKRENCKKLISEITEMIEEAQKYKIISPF